MCNPIPVMSALWQMAKYGHVYVPTTDQYYPRDNDVNGDKSNSSGPAQSDRPSSQPAQSELKKDSATRTPRASPKSQRD